MTKRYDRIMDSNKNESGFNTVKRLHQEDFCQAIGFDIYEKYEKDKGNYLKRIFKLIEDNSSKPINDKLALWDRMIFNFLLGNCDCHLKNMGFLYSEDMKSMALAPCYDVLSTSIYSKYSREMSLFIGGESSLDKINRNNFIIAAEDIRISERIAIKHFDDMANSFEKVVKDISLRLGFSNIGDLILSTGGFKNL